MSATPRWSPPDAEPGHAPDGYECPFCAVASGRRAGPTGEEHVVYRDGEVTALVALHWWPRNPDVLVLPNAHYEHLYALPVPLLCRVQAVAREVALALKRACGCEGVTVIQNNEPAGDQDVWHLHVHVIPRWDGDELLGRVREARRPEPAERAELAARLRPLLAHLGADGRE